MLFCGGFALAVLGPLLHRLDPLDLTGLPALPGHLIAVTGAMLAFAGQVGMGAFWRVGVQEEALGALVTEGLFRVSRNPESYPQFLARVPRWIGLPRR